MTAQLRRGKPFVASSSLEALEKYNIEKDIAAFIKKEFDKKYNPTWHCVVGRNFGSYATCLLNSPSRVSWKVTHETKHFIYFYLGLGPKAP